MPVSFLCALPFLPAFRPSLSISLAERGSGFRVDWLEGPASPSWTAPGPSTKQTSHRIRPGAPAAQRWTCDLFTAGLWGSMANGHSTSQVAQAPWVADPCMAEQSSPGHGRGIRGETPPMQPGGSGAWLLDARSSVGSLERCPRCPPPPGLAGCHAALDAQPCPSPPCPLQAQRHRAPQQSSHNAALCHDPVGTCSSQEQSRPFLWL